MALTISTNLQTFAANEGQTTNTLNPGFSGQGTNQIFLPQSETLFGIGPNGANAYRKRIAIQGDASYTTGGWTLTAANFGLSTLVGPITLEQELSGVGPWTGLVNGTNFKLLVKPVPAKYAGLSGLDFTYPAFTASTASEPLAATNVTSYSAILSCIGY